MSEIFDGEMSALKDLLAVVHRDGGHYLEEHGLRIAIAHAESVVLRERALDDIRFSAIADLEREREADRAAINEAARIGAGTGGDVALNQLAAWRKKHAAAITRATEPQRAQEGRG